MTLKYHQRSFDLLGIVPRESAVAAAELDEVERRLGASLPASVREWYSQAGAVDLLRRYSNDDPPIPINELGKTRQHIGGTFDQGLLPFRIENQGVCVWSVQLDGSDDPPVIVDVDTQPTERFVWAEKFSTHVYCFMWDCSLAMGRDRLVMANIDPVTDSTIAMLSKYFIQEPTTYGWPGGEQHRFRDEDRTVLIWANEDQADWLVSADTDESLKQLLTKFWHIEPFRQTACSNMPECESLLAKLQGES